MDKVLFQCVFKRLRHCYNLIVEFYWKYGLSHFLSVIPERKMRNETTKSQITKFVNSSDI